MGWIYDGVCHVVFTIAVGTLVTWAAWSADVRYLIGAVALFIAWDVGFGFSGRLSDRTGEEVMKAITDAKTTLSWFILIYGAMVTYVIANQKVDEMINSCVRVGLPKYLPILPLLLACFASMFVPIKRSENNDEDADAASSALTWMLVLTVILQKCVIVSFLYCLLVITFHHDKLGAAENEPAPNVENVEQAEADSPPG